MKSIFVGLFSLPYIIALFSCYCREGFSTPMFSISWASSSVDSWMYETPEGRVNIQLPEIEIDGVDQPGCDNPNRFHGTDQNSQDERRKNYGFLIPAYLGKNLASVVLGQNGFWEEILKTSPEGVCLFHEVLNKYKQVRVDVMAASLVHIGNHEIIRKYMKKINPKTDREWFPYFPIQRRLFQISQKIKPPVYFGILKMLK